MNLLNRFLGLEPQSKKIKKVPLGKIPGWMKSLRKRILGENFPTLRKKKVKPKAGSDSNDQALRKKIMDTISKF